MRLPQAVCLTILCAIGLLCGAPHWLRPAPVRAQQATGSYSDGEIYVYAYVNVDGSSNLSVDGSTDVIFDDYEDIDEVEVDGYAEQDYQFFDYGYDYGYDYAEVSANYGVVPSGHEYGMLSDGYACYDYDDGEDEYDCDWEYVGTASAAVSAAVPPPHIDSLSPSIVNQGDTGTLTISGSNLVENATDQLTINYSGSGMPFEPTGSPSSGTASFSYDFSGYSPGTYTISVTNNEGTSNSESFTVNPPLNACSQSTVPNAVTLQITQLGNQGGTFTVAHPTAVVSNATTTVNYGPFSTPSSVASSIATAITRNYVHLGLTAQSSGPAVTIQSRSLFGSVSASSGSTVGVPSSVSCMVLPQRPPPCDGLTPDYNTARLYTEDGFFETPRQHIIRKHINGAPSLGPPPITVYAKPPGLTADYVFGIVVGYNRTTVLMSLPQNGAYVRTFPKIKLFGVEFGFLGNDAAGNDLYTNKLFFSDPSRCTVRTSYPILP